MGHEQVMKLITNFRSRHGIDGTLAEDRQLAEDYLFKHKRENSFSLDIFLRTHFGREERGEHYG